MANLVNLTVADIKTSASGKNDVISMFRKVESNSPLGTTVRTIWYNTYVSPKSSKVSIDQEIKLDLDLFDIELSTLDNGSVSRWLMPKE